ncbi:MAG: methylated-DNA--[protein]-cysteine S-methyltransferase [Chloroflexota bacterium]
MEWGNRLTVDLRYAVFETEVGLVAVVGSPAGLRRVVIPHRSESGVWGLALEGAKEAAPDSAWFVDLAERMRRYFQGQRVAFEDELDITWATPFLRAVWEATRHIPYGETRSYGWVARWIGRPRAVRAVGQALARNPLPIIVPCHRVVASDGSPGGFTGGLELKKRLLALEARAAENA